MKKYLCLTLVAALILSVLCLAGCGENKTDVTEENFTEGLKFGVGSFSSMTAADAEDEEFVGEAGLTTTVAAVLLGEDGRILNCKLDSIENAVNFTVKGQVKEPTASMSKYEKGFDYMMSVYGIYQDKNGDGKVLEWFQQADAFCEIAKGKTLEELKAFVAENGYTSGDLETAGCTINSYDFIKAVEKAVTSASATTASENDTLKIGFAASYKGKDATTEENGEIENAFTFSVVTLAADGKVTDAYIDVASSTVEFDIKGVALTPRTEISTKKELGDNYNMAAYGTDANGDGVVLEWYKQAEVLENACIGKTAQEISALVVNGYQGTEDVQKAGCTIAVGDMVGATVKASTIA